MSNDFKLWSYQQKVEWLMEQVKKGTVDIDDLKEQVETNTGNIETNADDISDLDDRVEALENAPAPTGGIEIINVEVGEASQMGEDYYELVISNEDKAKVLEHPENYILAFTEKHVGTAYAQFTGSMSADDMGMNENAYGFTFLGTFPAIHDIQIFVGDIDLYFEKTYHTIDTNNSNYALGEVITCGIDPDNSNKLDLDAVQIMSIYNNPENVGYIKVEDSGDVQILRYDGFANNTVYFSSRKPVSGSNYSGAVFSITDVMGTKTQYYSG